jgi:signal transduction histidine kinase
MNARREPRVRHHIFAERSVRRAAGRQHDSARRPCGSAPQHDHRGIAAPGDWHHPGESPVRQRRSAAAPLYAVYLLGGLCAYGTQFVRDPRRLLAVYCAALAATTILLVAHLPVLALITLQFNLYGTFYRFPLRLALLLGTIPTVLFILLAYAIHLDAARENPPTTLFVVGLVYILDVVTGIIRRQNMITNQHLSWTREQLDREMARNAHLAIVQERARIARDMHDILAHSLTALSVELQAARQTIGTDPEQAARLLDEMAATLHQSVAESRELVQVLREAAAPGDDDPTLVAQLRRVADRFSERTGLRVTLNERGQARTVGADTIVALRFIVQEALTNAFKHGNAHQMTITLDWGDAALALLAADDGTPQTAQGDTGEGNGLRGMRERLEALGGTFAAGPRAGQPGFAVQVSVP